MPDNTDDVMKDVAVKAEEFLGAIELASIEVGNQALQELIKNPIGLQDTSKFNTKIKMPTQNELQVARRELAGAIAAEQWLDGFMMALSVIAMFGG